MNFNPEQLEWKLMLAIQELPEDQRAIFSLRYFNEMPYEKMVMIFNKPTITLRMDYFFAAKKIEAFILNS